MKKKLFAYGFIILFLVGSSSLLFNSCTKDSFQESDEEKISLRSTYTSSTEIEPDYNYLGEAFYEYLKNFQGIMSPEEFFLPDQFRNDFILKKDEFFNVYNNMSSDEILTLLVNQGTISNEFRLFKLNLYDELLNSVSDDEIETYLEMRFNSVKQLNMSDFEKISIKSEITYLKYFIRYIIELNQNNNDLRYIELRSTFDDCEIDWREFLTKISTYTTSGTAIGAAIGSVIPGVGTAIGAGVGALVGAFFGIAIEWNKTDQYQRFCERCVPTSLTKELTLNCDGSAYFSVISGSEPYQFDLKILNGKTINGLTTITIAPGQKVLIKQDHPDIPMHIQVISYCKFTKDTDLKIKKDFGPYNLFNDQIKVPAGALFFFGPSEFLFEPAPQLGETADTYNVYETVTYKLSGLAINLPDHYTITGIVGYSNAQNIILEGDNLTVTWKIDHYHWNKFTQKHSTEGNVSLLIRNNCPSGESKILTLWTMIYNINYYYDNPW